MLQFFGPETVSATLVPGDTGAYVNGEWTPATGVSSTIKIIAPQPLSANELQMFSDGEHVRDYLKTWTQTRVFVREGNEDNDKIQWNGKDYKVVQVNDRSVLGPFYRVVMREITADE
jgi:hypothetical protein